MMNIVYLFSSLFSLLDDRVHFCSFCRSFSFSLFSLFFIIFVLGFYGFLFFENEQLGKNEISLVTINGINWEIQMCCISNEKRKNENEKGCSFYLKMIFSVDWSR